MNTKIKLLSVGIMLITGFFGVAEFASAQTATATSCNSATVSGTLTSTGGATTNVWFEGSSSYNTVSAGLGTKTPTQSFSAPQSFTQTLLGLAESTTYYYRAVFSNTYGTAYGSILSFSTPQCTSTALAPVVTTSSASSVYQNSATLNGFVTPNNSNTNAWFEWGTSLVFGNTTASVNYGTNATSFSNSISGLMANTTYYYRAVAQSSQGTSYGSTMSFGTSQSNFVNSAPVVSTRNADTSSSFAVLNGYVDPVSTSDTVRWFEWGSSQSLGNSTQRLSHGSSASNFSDSATGLVSNTTYYYRAVARNSQGNAYGSILSFTTSGQVINNNTVVVNNGSLPAVTTLLATELTGTSVKLNGLVFTSSSQSSNSWFEWGVNSSLGNRTQITSVGNLPTIKHSDYISGLVEGQTYYYRIVAENTYGKVYGSINSFKSATYTSTVVVSRATTSVVTKPTVTVINRGSSAQSLVALSIEGGNELILGGEKRSYHVVWKNESTQALNNVALRVTFPQTMNFEGTTKGTFSPEDNAVIMDVKTLAPGESGDAFVTAVASRGVKVGELLVVTANMVYTSADGIQGDAIAYVTHRADVSGSTLGANIFGAGSFLPTTLLGWMLLIILVLILVLLGNNLYGRFSEETPAH